MLLTFLLVLCVNFSLLECRGLREEFSWSRITYEWPNTGKVRSRSTYHSISFPGNTNYRPEVTTPKFKPNDDFYTYENNIPMGANLWKNKLFITVPRRRLGVPSSLNFIWANSTNRRNVPLIPYPNWETNLLNNRRGRNKIKLVSVYRVAIDSCDRLWFVDTGRVETLGQSQNIQPASLVIMDLNTDRVLRRHIFSSDLLRPASGLASVTIDVPQQQCDRAYAYIPDLGGYAMIVYSFENDRSWRVNHNYFSFEPLAGDFKIGGHHFQWNDGIFSIALSGQKSDGFRDAYFHSMSGLNQYRVSTRILRNETAATRSFHEGDFEFVGKKGPLCQTSTCDMDKSNGILFMGLISLNALGCWNIKAPTSDISIIQNDNEKMIYPTDVKVQDGNVIVLTNSMPVFLYGTLDYDKINFRVWMESIDNAIKETNCDKI